MVSRREGPSERRVELPGARAAVEVLADDIILDDMVWLPSSRNIWLAARTLRGRREERLV